MLPRTYIAGEDKSMPRSKASEDKLSPLLGAKAAGDFKLKPVYIYHPENPTVFKNYDKSAMAPHSSTPAWKISWTEEPGALQSMGSLRVGHDRVTSLSLFTFMY